jgi:hypothetical protein
MSSEDIRYARRSDIGEVSASAELLGRLATVDWIELMVTLTENKSWYVREVRTFGSSPLRVQPFGLEHRCSNAHPADASTSEDQT